MDARRLPAKRIGGNADMIETNILSGTPAKAEIGTGTIEIGTVTAGDEAAVENVGSKRRVRLNFTLPRGAKGADGVNGKDGAPGAPGAPGAKGADGISPTVSTVATTGGTEVTITDAKGSHEFVVKDGAPGAKGADGADGITPHIGDNGNWYIGSTDTGKPSRGVAGESKGAFYVTVTQGDDNNVTADKTAAEVYAAYTAGYAVYAILNSSELGIACILPLSFAVDMSGTKAIAFISLLPGSPEENQQYVSIRYLGSDWSVYISELKRAEDGNLPPFTEADNNKVLGIVNGSLAWVAKT